eukprot:g1661.t1
MKPQFRGAFGAGEPVQQEKDHPADAAQAEGPDDIDNGAQTDFRKCLVQLGIYDRDEKKVVSWGSGSVISAHGHILTAAHVLPPKYSAVLVGMFEGEGKPTRWTYSCCVCSEEQALRQKADDELLVDLAVLQCTAKIKSVPSVNSLEIDLCLEDIDPSTLNMHYLPTNTKEEGGSKNVRLFGYPKQVCGNIFLTQENATASVQGNGWVKVNATAVATSGLSGGPLLNDIGEIVAVMSLDFHDKKCHQRHLKDGTADLSWFRHLSLLQTEHCMPVSEKQLPADLVVDARSQMATLEQKQATLEQKQEAQAVELRLDFAEAEHLAAKAREDHWRRKAGVAASATGLEHEDLTAGMHTHTPTDFSSDIKSLASKYHDGSRQWLFDEVQKWRKSEERMFWLTGEAGMGKSVVSAKICQELQHIGCRMLLGCYFCRHDNELRSDPATLVRSLALQCAERLTAFKQTLKAGNLMQKTCNITELGTLFDELICGPMSHVPKPGMKMVVLIDALDEAKLSGRNKLLRLISSRFDELPSWVGFIVTSRPERDIRRKLAKFKPVELQCDDPRNLDDLNSYLRQELEASSLPATELEGATKKLAAKTGGRFIYARFVVDMIRRGLADIGSLPDGLEGVYEDYLERLFVNANSRVCEWKEVKPLLELITAAPEPLPLVVAAKALAVEAKQVRKLAKSLETFFPLQGSTHKRSRSRFHVYHKSIVDYLCGDPESADLYAGSDADSNDSDGGQPHLFHIAKEHGHARLAALSLVERSNKQRSDSEHQRAGIRSDDADELISAYARRHVVTHCVQAEQWADVRDTLLDWRYIRERADAAELSALSCEYIRQGGAELRRHWRKQDQEQEQGAEEVEQKALAGLVELVGQACVMSTSNIQRGGPQWCADQLWNRLTPLLQQRGPKMHGTVAQRLKQMLEDLDVARRAQQSGAQMYSQAPQYAPAGMALERVLKGHGARLNSVCTFKTADGSSARIVSGSCDTTVRVWDEESGEELLVLKGHAHRVNSVCTFKTADGSVRIVSGSKDTTVRVWDEESGEELLALKDHGMPVHSVCMVPRTVRIVSGSSDHTVRVWDGESGEQLRALKGHGGHVYSVCAFVTADGSVRIVSGSSDTTVRVWDEESGKELLKLTRHREDVNSVCAFKTTDGSVRIVSGSNDKTMRVWDGESGEQVFMSNNNRGRQGFVHSVFSFVAAEGSVRIVKCCTKRIALIDGESGKEVLKLNDLSGMSRIVCYFTTADGSARIVSGSSDSSMRVWNIEPEIISVTVPVHHGNFVHSVCSFMTADGSVRIVSGSKDKTLRVRVWNGESEGKELVRNHGGHVYSVCTFVTADGSVRIVSGSCDTTVRVWDGESGDKLLVLSHDDEVNSVCTFKTADGSVRIVSGSKDTTVRVWDEESGEELLALKGHVNPVNSVCTLKTADGSVRIVSGSSDHTVRVWDGESGEQLRALKGHGGHVNSVCAFVTADGSVRIVSGSSDHTVRVWDGKSGEELRALKG